MKERLTGAIILVALIVLLVPELLSGPPRLKAAGTPPAGTTVAAAPLQSYTLPLGPGVRAPALRLSAPAAGSGGAAPSTSGARAASVQSFGAPLAAAAPAPAPAAPLALPRERKAKAEPEVQSPAQPLLQHSTAHPGRPTAPPRRTAPVRDPARPTPLRHPARATARTIRRAPAGGHWTVQLGVFSVHADALRLAGGVRAKGFGVRLAPLRIGGRLLWRVTAQAEPTRSAARQLARRLARVGVRGDLLRQ